MVHNTSRMTSVSTHASQQPPASPSGHTAVGVGKAVCKGPDTRIALNALCRDGTVQVRDLLLTYEAAVEASSLEAASSAQQLQQLAAAQAAQVDLQMQLQQCEQQTEHRLAAAADALGAATAEIEQLSEELLQVKQRQQQQVATEVRLHRARQAMHQLGYGSGKALMFKRNTCCIDLPAPPSPGVGCAQCVCCRAKNAQQHPNMRPHFMPGRHTAWHCGNRVGPVPPLAP